MSVFLNIMEELAEFSELSESIKSNISPISVSGVSESVMAHLVFSVCEKLKSGGLVIARSDSEAQKLYKDLCAFADRDRVLFYNKTELTLYDTEAKSRDTSTLRLSVLNRLVQSEMENKNDLIIVTSPDALLSVTFPRDRWDKACFHLDEGDEIELDELANTARQARLYKRRYG